MENSIDIWDRLILLPVMASVFTALAAGLYVLTSPRVFRRAPRRVAVALILFAYALMTIAEAPRAELGLWHVDALTFVRWCAQLVMWLVLGCLMRKIDDANASLPPKSPLWTAHAWRDGAA